MANTPISATSPDDINDYVQKQGHGVKGLSDIGIKTLPKQYIHPKENRLNMDKVANKDQGHYVPVIDMSNSNQLTVEKLICDAAKTWGFFQVINHGVPLELMENVKAAAYRFFELPVGEKRVYSKAKSRSNRVKYGTSFVPDFERSLEWKDYLTMAYVSDEEATALWPFVCRDEALKYLKSAESVIKQVFEILLRGLNVTEIDENKKSALIATRIINLNYYPKCPTPELTVGVGPHSDSSTLTVLVQDNVGGLYARGLDGESWVNIPPIKEALLFNIGDMFQILSNGVYKSAEHRVAANGCDNRVSVPIFVNPSLQEIISPFEEVISDEGENKAKYRKLLYLDYFQNYFKNAHNGKAAIQFATI